MRTYLKLATAGVSAAALAAAMAPAYAATHAAPIHVLTIKRVGGPAVKVGDILKAGIPTGKNATFKLIGATTTITVTCTKGSLTSKVTVNPLKLGTAKESVTAQTLSKCTLTGVSGVTLKGLKANNLPYKAKVSDAAGFPVTVSGSSSTKPLSVTATVLVGANPLSCTYTAAKITGHASNTGNVVKFSKQKFTVSSASPALCGSIAPTATFSATLGPVRDSSVPLTPRPRVFVN